MSVYPGCPCVNKPGVADWFIDLPPSSPIFFLNRHRPASCARGTAYVLPPRLSQLRRSRRGRVSLWRTTRRHGEKPARTAAGTLVSSLRLPALAGRRTRHSYQRSDPHRLARRRRIMSDHHEPSPEGPVFFTYEG